MSSSDTMDLYLHSSRKSRKALIGDNWLYTLCAHTSQFNQLMAATKCALLACSNPELKKSLDQVKERYVRQVCQHVTYLANFA